MVIILMGVCGSGKTTIGERLAEELGWPYFDADDFHPPANVAKMAAGIPLTDADRYPWLQALGEEIGRRRVAGGKAIFSCSALKEEYREMLHGGQGGVRFVYLKGTRELIIQRLRQRVHRYMPASLLDSQFATLEEPRDALVVDIDATPQAIVDQIRRELGI